MTHVNCNEFMGSYQKLPSGMN